VFHLSKKIWEKRGPLGKWGWKNHSKRGKLLTQEGEKDVHSPSKRSSEEGLEGGAHLPKDTEWG